MSAPAKTPQPIVDKLHDVEKALQDPALQERLAKLGVEQEQMSAESFGKFVKDDRASTVQLAKDAHAHIEPLD